MESVTPLFGPEANGPYEPLEDARFKSKFTAAEIEWALIMDTHQLSPAMEYGWYFVFSQ